MKGMLRVSLGFSLVVLVSPGCTHQEVINSPCANLNATVDIKPRADLAIAFGNDAIKAAINAVTTGLTQGRASVSDLTDTGKNAALEKANATGKSPSAGDMAELDRYLRRDVVPTIKQNPTCHFTVTASGKPYVGIEEIGLERQGDTKVPQVSFKNTGLSEAITEIGLQYLLDGKIIRSGSTKITLGPGQSRGVFLEETPLPVSDVESGKVKLSIRVSISYSPGEGGNSTSLQETWVYDYRSKTFTIPPQK